MIEQDHWSLIVLRTHGHHFMRPEKSWRPIITVEVDNHHHHETVMGSDGQNPNQKSIFYIHEAYAGSQIEIKVWHRAQSKKKHKKRTLVASACHSLGDLVKKQGSDNRLEVRLNCQTPKKKAIYSRGRPQNGAYVLLKLCPPSSFRIAVDSGCREDDGYSEASTSAKALSDTSTAPPSPTSEDDWIHFPHSDTEHLRPYTIDSDDELPDTLPELQEKPLLPDIPPGYTSDENADPYCDDPLAIKPPPEGTLSVLSSSPVEWIFGSMLPQYTEKVEIPSPMNPAERILSMFTMYSELKAAVFDSQYEKVFNRLQLEWTYVGGLLVALAAVDTAVFSISPDSMFKVDPIARSAIAASSIASGLGISCDAWFLLRYNWADLHTFINRARDVFGSYFFFSLSARVPSLCMLISAISLMGFLGRVAYTVWPEGVIVACFFIGLVMTLQFLVYGAHWCAVKAMAGGREVKKTVARSVSWASGKYIND